MSAAASDASLAFNFFVTAEHLPDWLHQRGLVKDNGILRIVSHLANGAKHFSLDPKRHKSVTATSLDTYAEDYAEPGYFEELLLVHLSENEAREFGAATVSTTVLGTMVLDFWRPYVPGA